MKFGVREICNVTFKATATQKFGKATVVTGQPCFFIDTAKTSTLEQASTTVYATGGRGNARLIAWEGEKTMTFTVEDALISPQGLAVLSGAGLYEAEKTKLQHVHMTFDTITDKNGIATVTLADINEELGTNLTSAIVCGDIASYATKLDGSGAGIAYYTAELQNKDAGVDDYKLVAAAPATFEVKNAAKEVVKGETVKLDFYVVMDAGVTEINIAPEDFGGFYYVEADTLFRSEATGKDMAASIILPKVKVQSGFSFTMASSGDPSTFTFTMDAFPGYTYFDKTKKVMCVMQVVGTDGNQEDVDLHPTYKAEDHVTEKQGN